MGFCPVRLEQSSLKTGHFGTWCLLPVRETLLPLREKVAGPAEPGPTDEGSLRRMDGPVRPLTRPRTNDGYAAGRGLPLPQGERAR